MSDPITEVPRHRMTADEFIAWAMDRDGRYEMEDGHVVRMAAEQATHARAKHRAARLLEDAAALAGLRCEVFPDGMAVPVDATTVFEPDALVRWGDPLAGGATRLADPVIVVEVSSPSTGRRDEGAKLIGYFRVPSLRHYIQIHPSQRVVVHHERTEGATTISTTIRGDGVLRLHPPGLDLSVEALLNLS